MLPRFRRGAFAVFALVFVGSMLLGDRAIAEHLVLHPSAVAKGSGVWQLLTASFVAPVGALWTIALTFVVQWTLGSRLEGFWGTTRFLVLLLVAGVVGEAALVGLTFVHADAGTSVAGGPSNFDAATAAAFAVVYGRERLRPFGGPEVSGRAAGILLALAAVLSPLLRSGAGDLGSLWPHLVPPAVAAAVALAFVARPFRRPPKSGKVGGRGNGRDRSHLRVVRNAEDLLN